MRTQFFPEWGKARLHAMIANRPDWTLSRQRQWGVPMPFFVHRETGALHPRTPELLEVDNVIICAGQVSNNKMYEPLKSKGVSVHLIGGADLATELDAKRAIDQGSRLAAVL